MTDGRTDGQTDGRTDGGDCNIPNAFLKKRGDNNNSCLQEGNTSKTLQWVTVQTFPNPELLKFKFLNLQDGYKNEEFKIKIMNCAYISEN